MLNFLIGILPSLHGAFTLGPATAAYIMEQSMGNMNEVMLMILGPRGNARDNLSLPCFLFSGFGLLVLVGFILIGALLQTIGKSCY